MSMAGFTNKLGRLKPRASKFDFEVCNSIKNLTSLNPIKSSLYVSSFSNWKILYTTGFNRVGNSHCFVGCIIIKAIIMRILLEASMLCTCNSD